MQLTVPHIGGVETPVCCVCVWVGVCEVVWVLIMLSESIRNNRALLNMDTQ